MPICERPDLRMHLRYKSISGLILNKALTSELAHHCAYCHNAIAARSIRGHYKDAHPQLLAYESLHRDRVHGSAQLGSGKGQCLLCEQTCNNVQRHQCGVLFQINVMLGQTYDASHFPIMPIMIHAIPANSNDADRSTPQPNQPNLTQKDLPQAAQVDLIQAPAQSSMYGTSGPSSLHKCTQCHMAFLSATGLLQHMREYHEPDMFDAGPTSLTQVPKRQKTSRTVQQMLSLPTSGPIPEAPRQFECPIHLEIIGRKALIRHLRREHQTTHVGAFAFVPDQDMFPGSLICRHCYSTFTMEQALITHFKRGSCPILTCQWAKAQHFGTLTIAVQVHSMPRVDHNLPALLHSYFELSHAGRKFDPETRLAADLVSPWFPMLYTLQWTPLHCVTWFRYTTDWISHFPELPHTCFQTDQVFAVIQALGHHPPIVWDWTDTERSPRQQWHEDAAHDKLADQLGSINHILCTLPGSWPKTTPADLICPIKMEIQQMEDDQSFQNLLTFDSMSRRIQEATTRDIIHRSQ